MKKIKNKTLKSAKKRIFINKNNKIKHKSSNKRHLLTKKSKKRKKRLTKTISKIYKKSNLIYKLINK